MIDCTSLYSPKTSSGPLSGLVSYTLESLSRERGIVCVDGMVERVLKGRVKTRDMANSKLHEYSSLAKPRER